MIFRIYKKSVDIRMKFIHRDVLFYRNRLSRIECRIKKFIARAYGKEGK